MIRFGSYCAGIEAASVAVERAGLDWSPAFLSEIAPFQREVLRVRQGAEDAERPRAGRGPMLWGDFTALRVRHLRRFGVDFPDMICGGTPCQAFSVAGARRSLADARGNLTLEFIKQAHAIDQSLAHAGRPGLVLVWENVPGVLNTEDNAFGCFLGGLVGHDDAVEGLPNAKRGKPERFGKWPDAGMVEGPRARAAWRVLDAQHFGLAQRRQRVFVVAGFRDRIDPAAVLFEPAGLRRNSKADRRAGESVAALTANGVGTCGADDNQGQAGHPIALDIVPAMTTRTGTGTGRDGMDEYCVAHTLRGEGFDASEDGTGRGTPIIPVCFSSKDHGSDAEFDLSPTLRAGAFDKSHANAGVPPAIAFALRGRDGGAMPEIEGDGDRVGALRAAEGGSSRDYIAFNARQDPIHGAKVPPLGAKDNGHGLLTGSAVRRLMPTECEALQGFPRNYTAIPWRGKPAEECPDRPRYMSLGNSWAINVVAWIFTRLDAELKRHDQAVAA